MIVVYDGVCNLCNAWVRFILPRDSAGRIRFAAMQSEVGKTLLQRHGLTIDNLDTLLVVDGERAYTQTAAIFQILRVLGYPWRFLAVLRLIPAFIRDPLYRRIARNRYAWFGKREVCLMPTPQYAERFIEALC